MEEAKGYTPCLALSLPESLHKTFDCMTVIEMLFIH